MSFGARGVWTAALGTESHGCIAAIAVSWTGRWEPACDRETAVSKYFVSGLTWHYSEHTHWQHIALASGEGAAPSRAPVLPS